MQKFYKSVIQFFEERVGEGTAWDLDYGKSCKKYYLKY